MTDRPILMNAAMVRAVLSGRKTQTRRPVKPQPSDDIVDVEYDDIAELWLGNTKEDNDLGFCSSWTARCPLGRTGDRLWVRETWDWRDWQSGQDGKIRIAYAADGEQVDRIAPPDWNPTIYNAEHWRPSIHMPRWASRITLPLVSVRVERVQDISERDAIAEGLQRTDYGWTDGTTGYDTVSAREAFRELWNSIYGTWDANPWVWVAEWDKAAAVVVT